MKRKYFSIVFICFLFSCQQDYIPETSEADQQYVVEGVIEAGEGSNVAYVLLTRSLPFIGSIDSGLLNQLFVHDADVRVNDGEHEVVLTELCLADLPDDIRNQASELLGFNADSIEVNICAYVDFLDLLNRREGGKYALDINVGDDHLSSITTIPYFVPIQSTRWDDPPGEPNDTLAELLVTVDDPKGENNYYRYFTGFPGEPLISPFASVAEDVFFDGQSFEFPLSKAEPRGEDFDDTFGLFTRGDSVVVKWTTIDEASFLFWNTLEFSANSGGPFSSYTRIQGNIEGGLGAWCGYAVGYYDLLVPVK